MEPDIEIRTYFVRGRNALVARGSFSELYAAWYLHRQDCGLPVPPACDDLSRDGIAALTLHCASRPRNETCAWTVHFADPRANFFAAGDNAEGSIVANVFDENVRETPGGIFCADVIADGRPPRRSVVEFGGDNFFKAAEKYYRASEQRAARFFRHSEEDIVMVAAQPDCDIAWLARLDTEAIRRLDRDNELSLLEARQYRFCCGCNQRRMLDLLAPVYARQGDELFGGKETVRIHCPRCGARHTITLEALEAHVS